MISKIPELDTFGGEITFVGTLGFVGVAVFSFTTFFAS
jgi:hypothetical protein